MPWVWFDLYVRDAIFSVNFVFVYSIIVVDVEVQKLQLFVIVLSFDCVLDAGDVVHWGYFGILLVYWMRVESYMAVIGK